MKIAVKHITLLLFICAMVASAQQNSYRIEGDEVVFTFQRKDYEMVTSSSLHGAAKFDGLDIDNVVVAGEFNDWSKYRWQMQKIDNDTYELRKKLSDFRHQYKWEFKYVINNEYWVEPPATKQNLLSLINNRFKTIPQNLTLYLAYPNENGNATFQLDGYSNAKKVILSGSFNRWSEHTFEMQKVGDTWQLKMQLPPGKHLYKFIVDGEWMADTSNPKKELNEFSGFNSVIQIKKEVTFRLASYLQAKKVVLSGSFNNWSEDELRMEMKDSTWQKTLLLNAGKHHYKFIVNGEWIVDPENSVREYDNKGNINSVCMVK